MRLWEVLATRRKGWGGEMKCWSEPEVASEAMANLRYWESKERIWHEEGGVFVD